MSSKIKLSDLGGCGCKIPANTLTKLLNPLQNQDFDKKLLVGLNQPDDCCVYDLNEAEFWLSTTDFFLPILENPFDFGQLSAANAISDIYAMGGTPLLATSILIFPQHLYSLDCIQSLLEGAKTMCQKANISICGGHTIEAKDLIFGLNVSGKCLKKNLKTKLGGQPNDYLFYTKPLGLGLLTSAFKKSLIDLETVEQAFPWLLSLNKIGEKLGQEDWVNALTDITGFGLIGHLSEMLKKDDLCAEVYFDKFSFLSELTSLENSARTDASYRNFSAFHELVDVSPTLDIKAILTWLYDPQTNGGLLFSVNHNNLNEAQNFLKNNSLAQFCTPIGQFFLPDSQKTKTLKKIYIK